MRQKSEELSESVWIEQKEGEKTRAGNTQLHGYKSLNWGKDGGVEGTTA